MGGFLVPQDYTDQLFFIEDGGIIESIAVPVSEALLKRRKLAYWIFRLDLLPPMTWLRSLPFKRFEIMSLTYKLLPQEWYSIYFDVKWIDKHGKVVKNYQRSHWLTFDWKEGKHLP